MKINCVEAFNDECMTIQVLDDEDFLIHTIKIRHHKGEVGTFLITPVSQSLRFTSQQIQSVFDEAAQHWMHTPKEEVTEGKMEERSQDDEKINKIVQFVSENLKLKTSFAGFLDNKIVLDIEIKDKKRFIKELKNILK